MKKTFAILLALVMILSLATVASAAATSDSGKGGNATITITLPTGIADTNETITYTVYKVFDATSDGSSDKISYQINSTNGALTDAMKTAGFAVDAAGNVTGPTSLDAAALAAIKAYAVNKVGEYTAKISDGTLKITGLEYGYYYITTTTGSVVTVDSTNPNATVDDKNTAPTVDKTITSAGSIDADGQNAIAEVGTVVEFEVEITVGKGATDYVFHDVMGAGLSYNNNVEVYLPDGDDDGNDLDKVVAGDDTFDTTAKDGDTITITFENDWISKLATSTVITIKYSATVTSDALSKDPANNTATLDYGDGHTTTESKVNVYNAKFTVTKQDGAGNALAGAGFVLKNAEGKYYKYNEEKTDADTGVVTPANVTWVDSIENATEYTSDANGAVTAFTGLADGTYTLIESTVPAGYNKAADSDFTIKAGEYTTTNLEQSAIVKNQSGAELPSTGGIGTTIFYIVGGILVVGAAVVLVTKKRMSVAE